MQTEYNPRGIKDTKIMELQVIGRAESLDACRKLAEEYFGITLRVIQEDLSMFEQYLVRPLERRHIPKIWLYRIVCKGGIYYFGRLDNNKTN